MVIVAMNSTILKLFETYKKWVMANPQLVSEIESIVRCLSYFTAGRFNNSALASEFIYSMPNLLVLCNDLLMYSGKYVTLKLPQFESKLKVWLTVLEYTEALLEVTARKLWGEPGRWILIVVIQILKTVLRLLLVYMYKERITKTPPISPLNREKLKDVYQKAQIPEGFTLKRTGTVIRSIRKSAPVHTRTWAPLPKSCENQNYTDAEKTKKSLMLAETLYIIKPLLHLGCISTNGTKHWKPWILSLTVDLVSLKLLSQNAKNVTFTKEEKEELDRRLLSLLVYILRSPFYDNYSRVKIYALLKTLSNRVPFARFVTEPVAKYLPHWQDMYFYMWSC